MDLLSYSADAGIARITLNRPEKRNALNPELIAALSEALAISAHDPAVRVVLITGAGKDFCAGLDLAALDANHEADAMGHLDSAQRLADVLLAIRRHPHPVVAAVQGRALGGGAGIATACDLILAAESAAIGYPEVKIGFVPAMVGALLRRSVTEKRMFELLAGGEPVAAREAQDNWPDQSRIRGRGVRSPRRGVCAGSGGQIGERVEPDQATSVSHGRDDARKSH